MEATCIFCRVQDVSTSDVTAQWIPAFDVQVGNPIDMWQNPCRRTLAVKPGPSSNSSRPPHPTPDPQSWYGDFTLWNPSSSEFVPASIPLTRLFFKPYRCCKGSDPLTLDSTSIPQQPSRQARQGGSIDKTTGPPTGCQLKIPLLLRPPRPFASHYPTTMMTTTPNDRYRGRAAAASAALMKRMTILHHQSRIHPPCFYRSRDRLRW